MTINDLYREAVRKGIEMDVRSGKVIEKILSEKKKEYERLDAKQKEFFDPDTLWNPFADTRIIAGDPDAPVTSVMVGIDIEGQELLLADRLRERGEGIDLVISHHPEGKALARFYDVMDLQVDIFAQEGIPISACENFLQERKMQVARRISAANHARSGDMAVKLGLNFVCLHTPCDNCAYQTLEGIIAREKPDTLGKIMDLLYAIPEYADVARNSNPPMIAVGSKNSRCKNIHLEFTGGTEGPQDIYKELSARGFDTIICMHQSEEHYKKCKEANINVIFASHIASDNIGVNVMLDHLERKAKLAVHEVSGFRRFKRKVKK